MVARRIRKPKRFESSGSFSRRHAHACVIRHELAFASFSVS